MVRKICLDSDVTIEILHNDLKTKEVISSLDAQFFATAINLFEIWYGRKKHETIFQFFESINPVSFDEKSVKLAADILRDLKQKGQMIDLKDLFIGAICIANSMELFTYNKKHFERLEAYGLVMI